MKKVLLVDHTKCTGCSLCNLVCSFVHEEKSSLIGSRIQILRIEEKILFIPIVCEMCEHTPCLYRCPSGAINMNAQLGTPVISEDLCVGCGLCVEACPYHAIFIHPLSRKALKCDLCGGDPQCVKFCPTEALKYVEASQEILEKKTQLSNERLQIVEEELKK